MNENEMIKHGDRKEGTQEQRQKAATHGKWNWPTEHGRIPRRDAWNDRRHSKKVAAVRRAIGRRGRDKWEQTTQGKLCLAFYWSFLADKEFLEQHEFAKRSPNGPLVDYDEHKLFEEGLRMVEDQRREREETLRRNLEKATEGGTLPARVPERRRVPGAPDERQEAVPDARPAGRGQGAEAGPGADGRPGQHTTGNHEATGSDYRREAGFQANWAPGVYDPTGGVERDEDEHGGGGGVRDGIAEIAEIARNRRNRESKTPTDRRGGAETEEIGDKTGLTTDQH